MAPAGVFCYIGFRMKNDQISKMNEPAGSLVPGPANHPPRILVAAHDPFIRHFSAEMLMRQGYWVNAAEDGAAAWEELQAINYHLLITGFKLPKVTGLGLIKRLRAAGHALPVVLLAEGPPAQSPAQYPSFQPMATLLQPVVVDALLNTVKTVLQVAARPK
jgi:DNA-binding NtrC family response regulator